MNKKIISIFLLLIIFVSITVMYSYFNQSTTEKQYENPVDTIDEDDIGNEIDNIFLEEDDEIEIGEMV